MMSTNGDSQSVQNIAAIDSDVHKNSQTASDYIDEQLALEADAREILPYKFDKCTYAIGPLRQGVFACLTCSPPPASPAQVYTPAGICYACSISCHGDHTLVELFTRRNFQCDCGTSRFQSTSPCALRSDPATGAKGVHSQAPAKTNSYNQNFQNHFCGCGQEYNAETEKGTMYQCLGLGTVENGGCGEDWWHAHCLMGLPKDWPENQTQQKPKARKPDAIPGEDDHPIPEGFPEDDAFSTIICYKCVESNPWLKQYTATQEFLPPLYKIDASGDGKGAAIITADPTMVLTETVTLKRKASEDDVSDRPASPSKRLKEDDVAALNRETDEKTSVIAKPKHENLPPAPTGVFSILAKKDFREQLCHCPECFPNLIPHPQLQEEEDEYEPSISDSEQSLVNGSGAHSHGTASLLDRGEAALNNVDRVRAIEGVMAYNHLKDKVKSFLKPYAESGQVVGAEDIKAYFEKLRGDEAAIKAAGKRPTLDEGDADDNPDINRKEQSGY